MNPVTGSGQTEEIVVHEGEYVRLGVQGCYGYQSALHGERNADWRLRLQALVEFRGGQRYDSITIQLDTGEVITYYFEITKQAHGAG